MAAEPDDPISVLQRMQHVREVNEEIQLYRNTGDARFLWRAFLLMRRAGDPIPEDLMLKFEEWGRKLIAADSPRKIASALELAGGPKRHIGPKHGAAYRMRFRLAAEVANVQKLYRITLTEAIAAVAHNNGVTAAVVKKAYHQVVPAKKSRQAMQTSREIDHTLRIWCK